MLIQCFWCGKDKEILDAEFRRQVKKGRVRFFCSLSCSVKKTNDLRGQKNPAIEKECPICHKFFKTKQNTKEKTFCSRKCANSTPERIEQVRELGYKYGKIYGGNNSDNFISIQETLKLREAWKYVLIDQYLNNANIEHEFEFCFDNKPNYIYDLAIIKSKTIIEFDSRYHNWEKQMERDNLKTEWAELRGWKVERVKTEQMCIIDECCIKHFFDIND